MSEATSEPVTIARHGAITCTLLPRMANRHGCITGATGTGKTVSMQVLAEAFSRMGTAVFMADVKGDFTGIAQPGTLGEGLARRLDKLDLPEPRWGGCPVTLWDVFAEQGHPVRATPLDMGPLLLARMLELNDTQEGILNLVFRLADDEGMLILDLKDLRAMLEHVADRATEVRKRYGNVSAASIGAIQRRLLQLESQGADRFFGEPMLDIEDLMRVDGSGHGMVNILAADRLMQAPRLYAVFLLWLLTSLYERLPEVGDLPQPKLVFFFDEAHVLFRQAPPALLEKIEQVVRLVRSKGVGVFFVTQNPLDIPDRVLGQLGNRIQHALRAYTPRDQKAVRSAAQTMRANPDLDLEAAISDLRVGEALVSMLDDQGRPSVTQRVWMYAPGSLIGPASTDVLRNLRLTSPLAEKYEQSIDRESAYELLQQRTEADASAAQEEQARASGESGKGVVGVVSEFFFGSTGPRGGRRDGLVQSMVKTEVRRTTRRVLRGVMGSLMGRR